MNRSHIAVVGAGFAGLAAASRLSSRHAVTVVDATRHFEWLPNLHELLSGVKTAPSLRLDRAAMVEHAGHRFARAEVAEVQPDRQRLITANGRALGFDVCIVAVGARDNRQRVPGAMQHALPLRCVADAMLIRRRLAELLRLARPAHVLIVGGGITGIEVLGEILRRHRNHAGLSIDLVEAGPRLLPGLPPALDADLRRLCAAQPVQLHTGTALARVTPKGVLLADGRRLRADLMLWTAGLAPPPLLAASGLARPPLPWATVSATLQSMHSETLFAAGDAAAPPQPLARQAFHAIDMGALAAANAERLLAGRPLKPFEPSAKPLLIAFGDLQTYLVAGNNVLAGKALAAAKEGVYQLYMAQMMPGSTLQRLPAATGRLWRGWRELALPELGSLARLARLGGLRLLR
jgi:NADH dehydrogenase FAD-containing subunit